VVRKLFPVLLLLCRAALCSAEASPSTFAFIYYGKVLLADPSGLQLRLVGTLSPAALAVASDPQGLIWGRLEPRHLAALDPGNGELVARVRLPRKPSHLLIAADGKAYVTHQSPAKEGFTLSVVDTRSKALLRELPGIAGLHTDLAQAAGFVYLAAEGATSEDSRYSYLYQVDGAGSRIREVLRFEDAGYFWKLAGDGDRLYLGYLPTREDPRLGKVEVRDARTMDLVGRWEKVPGPLRGLYAAAGRVLLFCGVGGGDTELLLLDPLLRAAPQVRRLQGPVGQVLGILGETLIYLDYPSEAGNRDVSVRLYGLEAGRELGRIKVRDFFLQPAGPLRR
jgi:hypothetical protein